MRDLQTAGCDLLTITQYLRPSPRHHPVERWVKPEEFVELREEALGLGFAGVMSGSAGPLVLPGRAAVRPGPRAARTRPYALATGGGHDRVRVRGRLLRGAGTVC